MLCLLSWSMSMEAKVTWGVRAGLSYSSLTQIINEEITYGGRLGFNVAGLAEIPLSRKFSILPEVAFLNQGGAYDYIYTVDNKAEKGRHSCNYYSLQVPVNLAYKFYFGEWQMGVLAGPFLSLSTPEREAHDWKSREFRVFDVGAGAGLSLELRGVYFSVYASTGFINKLRDKQPQESNIYQNNLTFSFGYWFPLKK